jgi:hypothetical protein
MSEPDDENPKPPAVPGPSPWISREGEVVHPDAPAGSGGLGRFRTPGSLGAEGNDPFDVRHPRAPSVRFETLSGDEKAEVLDDGVKVKEKPRNPPPKTVPEKKALKRILPAFDLDVVLEIVADDDAGTTSGAKTELDGSKVKLTGIGYEINPAPGQTEPKPADKVAALTGKATISGTATIQVVYGTVLGQRVRPEEEASWGRGTTPEDVAAKNITIGFHESCHRDDYVAYLTANLPIQGHSFRVGMTVAQYDAEAARIGKAIDDWFQAAETISRTKTDEVGTKMSEYVKAHPGSTGH